MGCHCHMPSPHRRPFIHIHLKHKENLVAGEAAIAIMVILSELLYQHVFGGASGIKN